MASNFYEKQRIVNIVKLSFDHIQELLSSTIESCKENRNKNLALVIQSMFSYYFRNFIRGNKVDEKVKFLQNMFLGARVSDEWASDFLRKEWAPSSSDELLKISNEICIMRFSKKDRSKNEIEKDIAEILVKFKKLIAMCEVCVCLLENKDFFIKVIDDKNEEPKKAYELIEDLIRSLGYSEKQLGFILCLIKDRSGADKWPIPDKKIDENRIKVAKIFFAERLKKLGYSKLLDERLIKNLKLFEKFKSIENIANEKEIKGYFVEIYQRLKVTLRDKLDESTVYDFIEKELQNIIGKSYITTFFKILNGLNRRSDIEEKIKNSNNEKRYKVSSGEVFQSVGTATNYAQ